MRSTVKLSLYIFLLALLSSNLEGQVAPGSYRFGTFEDGGFDSVNVGNLDVHFSIPVINKAGRGLPFFYNLSFDSSIWYPSTVSGSAVWTPVQAFGWAGDTQVATGYISYSSDTSTYGSGGKGGQCTVTRYFNFVYFDPFGVVHPFNSASTQRGTGGSCPSIPTDSAQAVDGSGLTLNLTNYTTSAIQTKLGQVLTVPSTSNGSASDTDSNGNQITLDGSGHFTDTTGNIVLTVAGTAPNSHTFTYKDTSGNAQVVSMTYKTYTVQTAFGCTGVGEYGPRSNSLVDTISFPDGSVYHFSYEPTPGNSSNVTGRIAGVELPQGNWILYGYSGGNNGVECADGSAAGLSRTLNSDSGSSSSTWTYTRSSPNGNGTTHTEVVDGLQNHLAFDFVELPPSSASGYSALYYETKRSVYQGAEAGTPVVVRQTCYNAAGSPCVSTPLTWPFTQIDTYETLDGIETHGSTVKLDSYGNQTELDTYDYATSSSRGSLLAKATWSYEQNFPGLPATYFIYDGSGNLAGETYYAYDQTTPTASSGVPQHVSVTGARGNLTSLAQYVKSQNYLSTTATYEDTGSVLTATTANGTTTLSYDSTFVYPTGIVLPTPSSGILQQVSTGFDTADTGLPILSTDPNSQATHFHYSDPLLRPTEVDFPDGGKSTISYTPLQRSQFGYQSSSVHSDTEALLDGYSRLSRIAVANGQSGNSWYQQDTCYDGNGNTSFTSYLYQGAGFSTGKVCSGSGDTVSYDVLGRAKTVTHANGESANYTYYGRATQTINENGVKRISQIDGLGRPTIVCEISSNGSMPGSSGSPISCGTDLSGVGFITTYAYDFANHKTTTTQGTQTRVFQTDWLGRPTSLIEPESGTTNYSYTYNSTGLLVTSTRPTANQINPSVLTTTNIQYDALSRIVSISYSDGTPTRTFAYDASTSPWGNSVQNPKGRMIYQGIPNAQSVYSYDVMGRLIWSGQCAPSNCGGTTYATSYTYDWLGNLLTSSDGSGATETYTYSPANEVLSVASSLNDSMHPPHLVSNVVNGPFGPLTWSLGNGLFAVRQYDGLGRVSGGWICSGSTQANCSGGSQVYSFTSGWQGVQIRNSYDSALNQTTSYGYDEFGRLTSKTVTSGTSGSYTYTYDRWGNRWYQNEVSGSGGPQPQLSFNTVTNQINTSGYGYDAAGNMTSDSFHSYTFDANGNITKVDGGSSGTFTYDALNRRVRIDQTGSDSVEFIFNPQGQHTSSWDVTNNSEANGWAFWGTLPVALYGNGSTEFAHQDWLGTERMRTTYNGQVAGTYNSLPFGDGYSHTGNDWTPNHFATLDHDSGSNTEHAQFRQYASTQGSWLSSDPVSQSYDSGNPQSFNRYVYVLDNPLSIIDSSGLCPPPGRNGKPRECGGGSPFANDGTIDGIDEFAFLSIPVLTLDWGYFPYQSFPTTPIPGMNGDMTVRTGQWGYGFVPEGDVLLLMNWGAGGSLSGGDPNPGGSDSNGNNECDGYHFEDPILGAVELTAKLGPEFEAGPAKIGISLYKNLMTGQTGSKGEVGSGFWGLTADNPTFKGGSLDGGGPNNIEWSGNLFGFVKNFTTGSLTFEPSKSWTFGVQALVGIEASWNAEKAYEIAAKNHRCGVDN